MKLIYVWIEEHKNIYDLGLVLDNSYEISRQWRGGTLSLTIKKIRQDGINIWGNNYNISAIVGKNGAGKSSVLEVINSVKYQQYNNEKSYLGKCFLLFENQPGDGFQEKFSCMLSFEKHFDLCIKDDKGNREEPHAIETFNSIVALWNRDIIDSYLPRDRKNFDFEYLKSAFLEYEKPFSFLEREFELKKYNYKLYYNDFLKAVGDFFGPEEESRRKDTKTARYRFVKKIENVLTSYSNRKLNIFPSDSALVLFDFIWWISEKYPDVYDKVIFYDDFILGEINQETVHHFIEILQRRNSILEEYPLKKIEKIYELFQNADDCFESKKFAVQKGSRFREYFASFQMNSLIRIDYFFSHPHSRKLIPYSSLSTGERQIINIMSWIYYYGAENNVLLIDEGENFMHPEWQRCYIEYLTEVLNKIYRKHHKYLNVIVTTHSPMILSDFLNKHVFFLENGGQNDDVNVKCFGANIYDLYNNGFFVEASVGEFARKKITAIDRRIKQGEIKDNDYALVEQIGEPMLRNALKNKLFSQRNLAVIKDYLEQCLENGDRETLDLLSLLSSRVREKYYEKN